MRLELNFPLFIVFLLISLMFWFNLKKQNGRKTTTKIFLILSCSLMLPAFIPGHGRIIVVFPNGALLGSLTSPAFIVGLFFVLIYSCLLFFIIKDQ